MVGGQTAANVIAECAKNNDFSYEALNRYQEQASAALDPGLQFNGLFRDALLNKEEVMDDFFAWVKKQPEYPHMSFSGSAIKYMKEVLGLDVEISENTRSQ